ncbi:Asp-tRNA(Asn)/Glu-tRNA(Gln) amidotransferase subunit GatC [Caldalkalibacillus salinus]|uniref:Asp-tRNA(Asn)/Glu-tRNA(Gln) amidotransferase subunit GatC n=1 Tax=Caldalkalibacillus salinus TaxID=2803787 RepID=UPI001F02ED62|nr:Asp-tRNA(Asn)/Glu-tRNA(Gln) amidotransferase subunit GatC [Caldalkalibacillus salinus]
MTISKKDVEHVAHLARLELSDEEANMFTKHLDDILTFVAKMDELDTANVEPTSHVLDLKNVTREDEVKPSLSAEDALRNTEEKENQQVKVPSVLGG